MVSTLYNAVNNKIDQKWLCCIYVLSLVQTLNFVNENYSARLSFIYNIQELYSSYMAKDRRLN